MLPSGHSSNLCTVVVDNAALTDSSDYWNNQRKYYRGISENHHFSDHPSRTLARQINPEIIGFWTASEARVELPNLPIPADR